MIGPRRWYLIWRISLKFRLLLSSWWSKKEKNRNFEKRFKLLEIFTFYCFQIYYYTYILYYTASKTTGIRPTPPSTARYTLFFFRFIFFFFFLKTLFRAVKLLRFLRNVFPPKTGYWTGTVPCGFFEESFWNFAYFSTVIRSKIEKVNISHTI